MVKMTVNISQSDFEFIQHWLADEDDESGYNMDAPSVLYGICNMATFEDVEK